MVAQSSKRGRTPTASRRLLCPACTHKLRPHGEKDPGAAGGEWGGMRSAPATYDLIEDTIPPPLRLGDKPEQEVPVYAWADPQAGRHLLHLVVISRRGAAHTINLWLSDLEKIVRHCAKDPNPLVFKLTPNVRALEVLGEAGIQAGHLPVRWRTALRRGYVDPAQDFDKGRAL